jgi:ethanolamine utilization microcompartment shell protein EutS
MGPLCFCDSCGLPLHNERKIINGAKLVKLANVELGKLATFDQTELLNGSMMAIMDGLELALCCRTVLNSYVDFTPEICN